MNANLSGTSTGATGTSMMRWAVKWLALCILAGFVGRAIAEPIPPPAPPMLIPPPVPAGQAAVVRTPERWLVIFDSSAAMKKRLPALEAELSQLFGTNMGDHLHAGDSLGVWSFDSKVHAGDYPLTTWQPENAAVTVTNLMKFVRKQGFNGETDFSALEKLVTQVIGTSERLTIVIFCDGEGQIHWTPYDDGINENLAEGAAERRKTRLPVVLVVRTQQGSFIGATVNYPPAGMTVPPFPALAVRPSPAPVHPAPTPAPAPHPVVELPPLIIVGKTEGTDTTATARFEATNVVARPNPIHTNPVNVPPPADTSSAPVQPASTAVMPEVATMPETNPVTNLAVAMPESNATPTNVAAGTVGEGTDRGTKILLAVGAAFLGAAIVLVVLFVTRRKRPAASLITSLMSEDPRYRK